MCSPLEEVKTIPKTRGGGTFSDPGTINLHGNDFSWEEKMEELSSDERKLVDEYLCRCQEEVRQLDLENLEFPITVCETEGNSWDSHYKVNKRHFPLKNYIVLAFPLLKSICSSQSQNECKYIVECGCGTGSTLLPLMRQFKDNIHFVGFDVSHSAVSTLLEHPIAREFTGQGSLTAFPYDISGVGTLSSDEPEKVRARKEYRDLKGTLVEKVPGCNVGVNGVILVFVLSSLPSFKSMLYALKELGSVLKNDGLLFFRDYAVPDHNLFRFVKQSNPTTNSLSFCKGDGTLQMFFEINFTRELFRLAGFEEVDGQGLQYHCNRIVNRKNGKKMDKVFINGTFKLSTSCSSD
ncbi:methyltransferase domain-containing protein [Trypanosoma theileri]|uniref:tRNA N(3)-methylcytidine methyltransferase n=1 Tax=Trypanosoma theileri TaxID=67003 RepID=A0A1X0NXB7_9TRYP|nr:methyltransferase domain-containing protein [Trypanosoma theileri]ORC89332.1 methyltransferase domain-containing protein [Trypanosoma theileri]